VAEKPKYKLPAEEKWQNFIEVAARVEHTPTLEVPRNRSDAVDPRRRQSRPAKAECGIHAQSESKYSLAPKDHASRSDEPRNRYFWQ
jgi:hypothetical protein